MFPLKYFNKVSIVLSSIRAVLSRPRYAVMAVIATTIILLVAILTPSHKTLSEIITNDYYSIWDKIKIFWGLLGFFQTNFTLASQLLTLILAILFGINFVLFIYHIKNRIKNEKAASLGLLGTLGAITGSLGIGCLSCGSIILFSILGVSTTTAYLGMLPFKGMEFGLIGIIFLSVSIYLISIRIKNLVCCIR